jgi:MFS family permease
LKFTPAPREYQLHQAGQIRTERIHHVVHYCLGMGFLLGVMTMNIPPALDALMEHYQVSYLRISVLITALLWPHSLGQLPSGILADRWPLKSNIILCNALMLGGNLLAVGFSGLAPAIIGRVICGLGTGLAFVAVMKLMALHCPAGRAGMFQAFFGAAVGVGSILSYACLPALSEMSWRWAYGLPALMAGFMLLWALVIKPRPLPPARTSLEPIKVAFGSKEAWVLGLVHALSWGSVIGLGNWTPSLLAESTGQAGSLQYAWLGILLMTINAVGRLVGGLVVVRFKPVGVLWFSMLSIGLGYLLLYLFELPVVVVGATILTMWWASATFGSIFQVASYSGRKSHMGSVIGLVNFVGNLGAIFTTMVCGWFKQETASFSGSFLVLMCAALIALWLTRKVLPEKGPAAG